MWWQAILAADLSRVCFCALCSRYVNIIAYYMLCSQVDLVIDIKGIKGITLLVCPQIPSFTENGVRQSRQLVPGCDIKKV